jgi:prevent-host-death family protein
MRDAPSYFHRAVPPANTKGVRLAEMNQVTDKELQDQTEALLARVAAGESFVITVDGKPVADLIPYER